MADIVQVKAVIPRTSLKRRAFGALALRGEKFSHWLQAQLEEWLRQIEQNGEGMTKDNLTLDKETTLPGKLQR